MRFRRCWISLHPLHEVFLGHVPVPLVVMFDSVIVMGLRFRAGCCLQLLTGADNLMCPLSDSRVFRKSTDLIHAEPRFMLKK